MRDTKERILSTALELFAAEGYEAASVREIADALGVTKGALYRHYASKRAIFESILARMEARDAEQARAFALPEAGEDCRAADTAQIAAFSKAMFRYWTQDEFAVQFRRLLTVEQYRREEMSRLYQQYLVSGPIGYVAELFAARGVARPREEAARFYAPMFLLYGVSDGASDKAETAALADRLIEDALARLNGKEG